VALVEFRDGKREIPEYLADMMSAPSKQYPIGLPTHTMSFEQAVAEANRVMVATHVNNAADALVRSHFRNGAG
jgi:hypothetical protein